MQGFPRRRPATLIQWNVQQTGCQEEGVAGIEQEAPTKGDPMSLLPPFSRGKARERDLGFGCFC